METATIAGSGHTQVWASMPSKRVRGDCQLAREGQREGPQLESNDQAIIK